VKVADELRAVAVRLIELLEGEGIAYAFMGGIVIPVWSARLGVTPRLEAALLLAGLG
jgi:hypothetical protein